ncbi:MAG: sulfur carrier protein ThiS [Gammaproteobacteria bacterium]|nr:MAG: sulfur carrier protein ThiS [Gammaproteobacteria bacterium]
MSSPVRIHMQIFLNGDKTPVPDQLTVAALLKQMELVGKRVAVEVNREIVPRAEHETFRLNEQDRVEVIHAIGGG